MHILVAPVSGGAFPVQLGFMIELAKLRRPQPCPDREQDPFPALLPFYDSILASSGGNVATYMALAGDFTPEGIDRVCHKLHPNLFLSSWWPRPFCSILPSWILGYYEGSIFNRGCGVEKVFEEIFTPASIGRVEIWTGTLNRSTGRAELFTNLEPGESKLALDCFSPDKLNAMPLTYLSRDRKMLAQVAYASAAIPVLVPSVEINSIQYADGGTCFSSPLTPLQDCITSALQNHDGSGQCLHVDYLSSYDLESTSKPATYKNLLENGSIALAEIIKSLGVQDRLSGIELLRVGEIKFDSGLCDPEILASIMTRRQKYRQSFLELFPSKEIEINLERFTAQDITNAINETRKCMMYRLWYIE